jgi:carbon-monoxide dehydrogenase medium subunit
MVFKYHAPTSIAATVDLLTRYHPEAALLAGGTALLVDIRNGKTRPGHIISLSGVPDLGDIHYGEAMRIGALVTLSDLAEAVAGIPGLQCLAEACRMVGGWQIQNVATVGGNICRASPAADMVPPLLCCDAVLELVGPSGIRQTPLDGFLIAPDKAAISPGEVLTKIILSPPPPRTGTAFLKIMRRKARDLAIVCAACRVSLSSDGRCREARIALGAVAPYPFLAKQAEKVLVGQELVPDIIREAARLACEASQPISDVRASAEYRKMLAETVVQKGLVRAHELALAGC